MLSVGPLAVLFASGPLDGFPLGLTGELSQQGSEHKEDVAALQRSVSALDREKDALQDEVDEKTERLVALQEELSKKVATADRPHPDG